MAYLLKARIVSRQWLSKHIPVRLDTHATKEGLLETVFPTWSMQKGYKEDNWGNEVSSVWDAAMKRDSWKRVGMKLLFREDLSPEAEESALLEAVIRKWLVRTQQAGKGLAGAVVICELWRLAVAL
jgi:hypothetical protein